MGSLAELEAFVYFTMGLRRKLVLQEVDEIVGRGYDQDFLKVSSMTACASSIREMEVVVYNMDQRKVKWSVPSQLFQ